MLFKFKQLFDGQIKKLRRQSFKKRLQKVQRKDFTIISSNCIGGTVYQLLSLPYMTPTVGLYFFAPCFLKFVSNLQEYLGEDLIQISESKYLQGNNNRKQNNMYPLGRLGDVEIHFMHYSNWDEVIQKWTRRTNRVNFDNLFFIFTDKDLCTYPILNAYDKLVLSKKVCFTAKKYNLKSCIQIPYYANNNEVGNLAADYHLFNNYFDFVRWFDEPAESVSFNIDSQSQ